MSLNRFVNTPTDVVLIASISINGNTRFNIGEIGTLGFPRAPCLSRF